MPVLCREAEALTDDTAVLAVFEAANITEADLVLIEHPTYAEYNRVVVVGVPAHERRAAERVELTKAQDERAARTRGGLTGRRRDDMLCDMQRRQFAAGLTEFKLSTNIYGWCVEKTTNLGGGAHAQTRRGLTKAEAISWGIEWAKADPARRYFTIYTSYLPAELQEVE